jgi:hypothetical protein
MPRRLADGDSGGDCPLWTAYAKAKNASLDARREALFSALGCGSDCEFGYRAIANAVAAGDHRILTGRCRAVRP